MHDSLALISEILAQHQSLRSQVIGVGEATNDLEAVFALQRAHAGWAQSPPEALDERRKLLGKSLDSLNAGLAKHFGFEERFLPPLFGDVLMKALVLEHRQVSEEIGKTRALVSGGGLEGLSPADVLAWKSRLQQETAGLCHRIEEHASHEELVLRMIKRALEAEASV
ncbi:MAG: hemerythrin domain-containing protein [Chloroflexi bacterium]|nr:hemerythrin domain-containing protein [Chloroflexota bacterium]